jgi:hypothetical protein
MHPTPSLGAVLHRHSKQAFGAVLHAHRRPSEQKDTFRGGSMGTSMHSFNSPEEGMSAAKTQTLSIPKQYNAGCASSDLLLSHMMNNHQSLAFKDHWVHLHLACLSMIGDVPLRSSTLKSTGKLIMRALKKSLSAKPENGPGSDYVIEAALTTVLKMASREVGVNLIR